MGYRSRLLLAGALLAVALSACVRQLPPVTEFGLTVTVDGDGVGVVTSDPAGIDTATGDVTAAFATGTVVTLTATPADDSVFQGFEPADACGDGSTAETCVVTMTAAVAVTATFALEEVPPVVERTLTVVVAGAGVGEVLSTPAGIDTAEGVEAFAFAEGTVVTLEAIPGAGSSVAGFVVEDGACEDGSTLTTCVITLDADTTVTALFAPPVTLVPLAVRLLGDGTGRVVSEPAGIDTSLGASNADYPSGTTVRLTATPSEGSEFAGWSGDACDGSTVPVCVVVMNNAPIQVWATFSSTILESLTVNVAAGGAAVGAVTSNPPGINTAVGANTADFPIGSTVLLTAAATAGGFAGWTGGDCDGLKTLECEVTMDAGEPAVTANFNDVVTLTARVAANTDDAVEFLTASTTNPTRWPAGWVWANFDRFDIGGDPDHARTEAGLRFPGVTVPAGANVMGAVLQLTAYVAGETGSTGDLTLAVRGQLATDAAGFPQDPVDTLTPSFGITGRTNRTVAATNWSISGAWTANLAYQSPDIGAVVREIVNLPAWSANDTIVLFLSNVDPLNVESRRVWSFDGAGAGDPRAPTLLIEYVALP